jgi:hypothetical protein
MKRTNVFVLIMQEKSMIRKDFSKKNFARTIARKMSTGRGQQIKTEYTVNKILYFFRIILLLFHISFYFFLVYYSIIFLNIFNFP